ncbi:MAG: adenine phosphoribosyltransferase [Flavobacteriales bacterium]|nr:adenine phosphoribosyltransferase [Flavobacteriales bacterium]
MTLEQIENHIRAVPDFPKPGILFRDITPLLGHAKARKAVLDHLLEALSDWEIDAIAGIESRGFLFGMTLADALNIPFVPIRKAGKLPYDKIEHSYELEYGSATLEIHTDAIQPGDRVLIHDDLLATGGTAAAAAELLKRLDADVAGFSFIIALNFLGGDEVLRKYSGSIHTLISY